MLAVTKIIVDGMSFQLIPLPALKALRLDKKVVTVLIPAISGLKELNLDAQIDLESLSRGISEALSRLSDDDFENLAIDLLSSVTYIPDNAVPIELTSTQEINNIFSGKLITIYKLFFEVMKYNKFSPFALLEGDGNLMSKIIGLSRPDSTKKESGTQSGKLGL